MSIEFEVLSKEFARSPLGDVRRRIRAADLASLLVVASGRSLAQACGTWASAKATYSLLRKPIVTPENLLLGHRLETAARATGRRVVLAAQDTTTLSFGDRQPIDGMGPIDSGVSVQGFFAHTALLVDPDTETILGVGGQEIWARSWTPAPKAETGDERKKRARESEHWARVQEDVARAFGRDVGEDGVWTPAASTAPRVVAVFDREGDIFEAMETLQALGHGFVIRAIRSRKLKDPIGDATLSFDAVERAAELGEVKLVVPRRPGQPGRPATLTVRSVSFNVLPPKNRGRKGRDLELSMVLIREESPPDGIEPLEWYLVTTEPCATMDEAVRVVTYYRFRWRVEEFHMGLKTGCGVERAQLGSYHAFSNLVSIASVSAWRLLRLRDEARTDAPDAPPEVLNDVQKAVLRARFPRLAATPRAREWLRAVAMLGGFLGRKSDGEPGWRALWWGWQRLEQLEQGWRLAHQRFG